MHTTHLSLSRFQVVVAVLLAIVSLASAAQPAIKKSPNLGFASWNYRGCWSDTDSVNRALNTQVTVQGGLAHASVENCIAECNSMSFHMAGVEEKTCYCGKSLNKNSMQIAESNCNTVCTGDSTELCGGPQAILVYSN
ncbi:WSC domain-containing protein [Lactarius quietus]|nr:WSC domain-containing protein [Lactarius quietus]KAF8266296.1 WSC domain-containing protein [Lactarius quietus]